MIAEMISVKGFSLAFGKMSAGLGIGVLSFEIANLATNNTVWAITISVACQAIFAYFISRPKLVSAQSAAMVAERQQAMTEWATLLKQNNDTHSEQIRACRDENKELSRKIALMHISKNNVMDACGLAYRHITLLDSILKDNNLTIPAFTPKTIKEMIGTEDEEMLKIVNGK